MLEFSQANRVVNSRRVADYHYDPGVRIVEVIARYPENCLTCGAWGDVFQWFPPASWLEALSPIAALVRLRQTLLDVSARSGGYCARGRYRQRSIVVFPGLP